MGILPDLVLAVAAFGASIWGLIALIKILNGMNDDADFKKLSLWLDFIKVFLGTFVIGLLGYFAKLSFDNRNLAIMESDQIGQYVEQAMVDDLEVRLRFAEYFNTVLPKDRTTGWKEYYADLKAEYLKRELNIDSLQFAINQRDSLAEIISSGMAKSRDVRAYKELVILIDKKQHDIKSTEKLVGSKTSGRASIIDPLKDFVTCSYVRNNQPFNIRKDFPLGRVTVFARIYSPKSESVTINWRDSDGNILNNGSKSYPISRNEDSGYRLSSWKNILNPGTYSVEINNEAGETIGNTNFSISE